MPRPLPICVAALTILAVSGLLWLIAVMMIRLLPFPWIVGASILLTLFGIFIFWRLVT